VSVRLRLVGRPCVRVHSAQVDVQSRQNPPWQPLLLLHRLLLRLPALVPGLLRRRRSLGPWGRAGVLEPRRNVRGNIRLGPIRRLLQLILRRQLRLLLVMKLQLRLLLLLLQLLIFLVPLVLLLDVKLCLAQLLLVPQAVLLPVPLQ